VFSVILTVEHTVGCSKHNGVRVYGVQDVSGILGRD
jgi:hypothetical protein